MACQLPINPKYSVEYSSSSISSGLWSNHFIAIVLFGMVQDYKDHTHQALSTIVKLKYIHIYLVISGSFCPKLED